MVAMNVWPTDAADGAVTSEARWRKMGRLWTPSGVAAGQGGEMMPSLAGTNLTVSSGACWIDGHYAELTSDQVLTVTANGLAVVRFDPAANTAELLYRDGVTVPAQNPTGTWELPIAQITGSALTDRRGTLLPASTNKGIPYLRFTQPQVAIPGGVNTSFTFSGLTDVVDPFAMIGPNYLVIPSGWSGLWQFNVAFDYGSHASAGSASGWVDYKSIRYAMSQVKVDAVYGQRPGGAAVIPVAASQAVTLWASHNNPSAMAIGIIVNAAFLGRSPL